MIRILIGSILGGLVQFLIGAIAWATPLGKVAFKSLGDVPTADLHTALARTLTPTGTGTYFVPSPETPAGTALLGRGPVALIHFNSAGFPPMDPASLLTGLLLSVIMLFLTGVALSMIDGFARRMQALVMVASATVLYFVVALPVFNPYMPWDWWTYLAASSFIGFVTGGFVMLRWFMPKVREPATPAS